MGDFLLRLLQALLSSFYVVLGRVPAIEQLRRAFAGAGGSVLASTSRGGSPASTPTRRRPSGPGASAGGGGGPAFSDVKLD